MITNFFKTNHIWNAQDLECNSISSIKDVNFNRTTMNIQNSKYEKSSCVENKALK